MASGISARTLSAFNGQVGPKVGMDQLKHATMEVAFDRIMEQFEIECQVLNLEPQDFEPETWTCVYKEFAVVEAGQTKITCDLSVSFARKQKIITPPIKPPVLPLDAFKIS